MESIEKGSKTYKTMWNQKKGGHRAAMFVYVMTGLENVGFVANAVSLVLYFIGVMHFDLTGSASTLTNFMGSTFLCTILGGFLSDTYMTRLNTVLMFGFLEIVGYILLTVQARYKDLHPDFYCPACKLEGNNKILFYLSLCFLAVGFGGTRGVLPSLGADQFDKNDPKERKQLGSFFNWLLMGTILGATFGVTVIIWVSTKKSTWAVGFLSEMLIAIVGFGFLMFGKPFYRNRVAGDSSLLRIFQVITVAIQNRKLSLPDSSEALYDINEKKDVEEKIPHSEQFRFLDKAAILAEGTNPEPGKICSVTQVEEVKIILRMLPILASTIIMNTCLAQLQTVSVQQGNMMNLYLGKFQVPAASIPVIPLVFMTILLPTYELAFVPFARRITGHPTGITHLQRVAVGLVLSAVSMAVAAIVEVKRKNAFNIHSKQISLFWLSFQYGIFGIADMFTLVGLMAFFYSEAPAGMRSLATSFTFLSLSMGFFLSTAFVQLVEKITAKLSSNGQGWLYGLNLNANHVDKFYWLMSIMSCVNFGVYVLCAYWYKYREVHCHHEGSGTDNMEVKSEEFVKKSKSEEPKNEDMKPSVQEANHQSGTDNMEVESEEFVKNKKLEEPKNEDMKPSVQEANHQSGTDNMEAESEEFVKNEKSEEQKREDMMPSVQEANCQ